MSKCSLSRPMICDDYGFFDDDFRRFRSYHSRLLPRLPLRFLCALRHLRRLLRCLRRRPNELVYVLCDGFGTRLLPLIGYRDRVRKNRIFMVVRLLKSHEN